MMNRKKLLALLLAIVMVVGMFPMNVFAENEEPAHLDSCTEGCTGCECACHQVNPASDDPAEPESPADNCPNCDNADCIGCDGEAKLQNDGGEAKDEVCETCQKDPCECKSEVCETCQKNPCECKSEVCETCQKDPCECKSEVCETCQKDPCECKSEVCETCQKDPCECKSEVCETCQKDPCECKSEVCETCQKDPCECKNTEETKCALCESTEHATNQCSLFCGFCQKVPCECVACDKCGQKNDHTPGCVNEPCEKCEKNPCECIKTCEHCGVELTEDAEHAEDCLSLCTCESEDGEHQEGCALYTEPEVVTLTVDVDGVSIAIAGDIPEDVKLSAAYVPEQVKFKLFGSKKIPQFNPAVYDLIGEDGEVRFCFDITPLDADGNVWQPAEGETVSITLDVTPFEIEDGTSIGIIHDHNGELKRLGEYIVSDGKLTFETDGFSTYTGFTGTGVLVDGSYFYNMATATSVNLSTILTAIGVTDHKAKDATSVTPQIDGTTTTLITATQNATKDNWAIARPLALEEKNVKLHVVFSDKTNIDITITDQGYKYYLTGTPWDFGDGTENVTITPSGLTDSVNLKVNKAALRESDMENHKTTYVKPKEGASVPAAYETIHLLIYMRAGEALKVNTGTYFPHGSWVAADYTAGKYHKDNWTWIYTDDGTGTAANYIVADNVTEPVVCDIQFRDVAADKDKKWIVNTKLIIVPEFVDEPTLVRDTLPEGDRYSIAELPITLYNYDGAKFNDYYKNQTYYLGFANYSKGVLANKETLPWSGTNLPNSGSVSTGIMKNTLVNGVPVANSTANTDFFSTTEFDGKDVTENVDFEFIYDNNTGYYTYSSNLNHAQYNASTKTIELYNETLAPAFDVNICNVTYSSLQNARAGFYPFGNIQSAFMNAKDPNAEYVYWRDHLHDAYVQQNALYAQDPVTTKSIEPMSSMDMHFGLQLKTPFYMPKGSQVDVNNDGTMEDLIYTFTGDDDLWVYVDGKLALDIGGAHTAISGTINFTKKTVTLGNYAMVTANGNEWTLGETGTSKVLTFEKLGLNVAEDTMHTLQIFYLERWSGESNCRMEFNLPLIPSDSVNVSKNLTSDDGQDLAVTPDAQYTFTVYTKKYGETELVPIVGEYTLIGADKSKGETDAAGRFTLRDGWMASFAGITTDTEVYVVEANPNGSTFEYSGAKVSVNGVESDYEFGKHTEVQRMQTGSTINFMFTNKVVSHDLSINKALKNPEKAPMEEDVEYEFQVNLDNKPYSGKIKIGETEATVVNGNFTMPAGQTAVIENIPKNMSYAVTETQPDETAVYSYDAPLYTNASGTITTDVNATVTNTVRLRYANLTIKKTGIDDLDHHATNASGKEEWQNTIYTITGTSSAGVTIEPIEVVIYGNTSVTIKSLPIGNYTVTENAGWSWRYGVDTITAEKDTNEVGVGNSVTFDLTWENETVNYKNKRKNIYWLSGDSYAENWWGGEKGTVTRR